MRKSIKQSGKLKCAEQVTIEMGTQNRKQRPANQKTRTPAKPTQTQAQNQNRNRNRKRYEKRTQIKIRNGITLWQLQSKATMRNVKSNLHLANASAPLPLCPLLPTLNISTNNDRIGAPQMCCSCNKILHTCNGNLPLISLCTYFVATSRGEASHPALRGVYVLRSQARPCYAVLHWAGLGRTRPHRV